jgi:hypothetical protein
MTVHSSSAPDWKVTAGHRVLVKVGWGLTVLAVYLGAAAVVIDLDQAWWAVAALATAAILMGLMLPEPVPREMLTGHRTRVDTTRTR